MAEQTMTIQEVLDRTPNGLHDAYLLGISTNYPERTLRLEINWLVGFPEGKTHEEREGYRLGSLLIRGLRYCVVEAPQLGNGEEPDQINGSETKPEDIERCKLPDVDDGVFRYSIYLYYWESFIHFAGTSAEVIPADLLAREMVA